MATQAQIHFGLKELIAPAVEPVTTAEAKSYMRVDTTDDDTLIGGLITAVRQHVESVTRRVFTAAVWQFTLDEFPSSREAIVLPKSPLFYIKQISYVDTSGVTQTWGDALMEILVTPALIESTDVFDILIGGITVASFAATDTTVSGVCLGLQSAWNDSARQDLTADFTATNQGTTLQLLGNAAGLGVAVTTSTTDNGGADTQTLTATVINDESTLYTVDDVSTPARIRPVSSASYPDTQKDIVNAVTIDMMCGYGGASSVPELVKTLIKVGVAGFYEHREPFTEARLQENEAFTAMLWSLRLPRAM